MTLEVDGYCDIKRKQGNYSLVFCKCKLFCIRAVAAVSLAAVQTLLTLTGCTIFKPAAVLMHLSLVHTLTGAGAAGCSPFRAFLNAFLYVLLHILQTGIILLLGNGSGVQPGLEFSLVLFGNGIN